MGHLWLTGWRDELVVLHCFRHVRDQEIGEANKNQNEFNKGLTNKIERHKTPKTNLNEKTYLASQG